jgi:hypothetical protein
MLGVSYRVFRMIPHPLMNKVSFGSEYESDKDVLGGFLIPVSPFFVVWSCDAFRLRVAGVARARFD